ncbi:MAG TPA: amidohydrolase family protein [Acidobacteriota bacterium]|nr:amidohydrolase family protein [Acidobacteriota bacterium]
MKPVILVVFALLLAFIVLTFVPTTGASEETDLKKVPIQDYDPVPMLKTDVNLVDKAKYPAVDIHNHLRRADTPARVDEMIRAMNETGVTAVVNLDGGWGEALEKNIERMNKRYPGRFIQFMRLDWSRIDEPGFGETMARELEKGVQMGAQGLKISKQLGLGVRDKTGELIRVDDPRLDPVWAKCGELKLPVAIHIADPVAFWTPLDTKNERLIELMDHPQWVYGPEFPSREELLRQRNTVIERHPNTTFIALHIAGAAEDLKRVGGWLDKYPNMCVETGARISELGRQPYTARLFFLKYQDRVLFGTDTTPLSGVKLAKDGQEMYRIHWRWFETDDEYFDVSKTHHLQALWRACGIYLPDEVLKKLYYGNAVRLVPDLKVSAMP